MNISTVHKNVCNYTMHHIGAEGAIQNMGVYSIIKTNLYGKYVSLCLL